MLCMRAGSRYEIWLTLVPGRRFCGLRRSRLGVQISPARTLPPQARQIPSLPTNAFAYRLRARTSVNETRPRQTFPLELQLWDGIADLDTCISEYIYEFIL